MDHDWVDNLPIWLAPIVIVARYLLAVAALPVALFAIVALIRAL